MELDRPFVKTLVLKFIFKPKSLYLLLKPDALIMASIYVYDAIAVAADVLPSHQTRSVMDGRKRVIFSCGSPFVRCMNLNTAAPD